MLGNFRPPDPLSGLPGPARRSGWHARIAGPDGLVAPTGWYPSAKPVLDFVVAALLALVLGPVIAATALLIVLTSPGPAFYTQVRLGRFGRPFIIWKLRTMEHNCEDGSGAQWSTPGDRRVTPLGRILRKLHIDEFPQLWNVLRGDMSLVGPRPERPEFFPVLSAAIPNYPQRLLVKPGVTGLAQVYLPPDEDVEGVRRKQAHDLHYIRTFGLGLDVRLLIATAVQAVGLPHVLVRPLLHLPSSRTFETARPATPPGATPAPHVHQPISPPSTPVAS
jgi:lipopolysaccharide/colanic/teichoic acid biosynthesis glycosyltransferase